MSRRSLLRRLRRRVRAFTLWEWFFLFFVVSGINQALKPHQLDLFDREQDLRYQIADRCREMAEDRLGYKKRIGFRSVLGYKRTKNRDNVWSHNSWIENPNGDVIGFLHCNFNEPALDIRQRLVQGSKPTVEIFDFREAKRKTYRY